MPQPLSRVMPKANIILCSAGQRITDHNRDLGILVAEAIISWTNVESFMLNTYLSLMGGPSERAGVAYMALEGQSAKRNAILAVAREFLDERKHKIFEAIFKRVSAAAKERNKLAHWQWGYSPEIPDAFLLQNPKNSIMKVNPGEDLSLAFSKLTEITYVYKDNDFKSIITENDTICQLGLTLSWVIGGHISDRNGALSQRLCQELGIKLS